MAVLEVSIVPVGTSSTSLSAYVADCLKTLRETGGISYRLTPMGTIIEGDLEVLLKVVREMHEQPFRAGAGRVVTAIRIDDRRDRPLTMDGKVASVERKLTGQ
ncbi:hypothetical protein DCCM_4260 [Desulfocucumis palustris]|uniref:Thiamine-binding protein domain-containing protein n=1 Tax=Desulfocucumis palustris TaxID=1898651 RepID=A0A2L2XFM6_9FIRM|nr:MTH1187 family thiamine-binding protein [Desulfocucumis palustris]GBF35137.1 hypothetical protein DCCM_4260 [Desulfocucumis palustris]